MTLIFDFDSTLLSCEGLELLALMKNISDEDYSKMEEYTHQGMSGEIPLEESISQRLNILNIKEGEISNYIEEYISRISASVIDNIDFFKENSPNIYVVSGGFIEFVKPVAEFLGINSNQIFANKLVYKDNVAIGVDESMPLYKNNGKPNFIRTLNLQSPVVMIGDGGTDYEVRNCGEADIFIAYVENVVRPSVVENADFVANNMNEVFEIIAQL